MIRWRVLDNDREGWIGHGTGEDVYLVFKNGTRMDLRFFGSNGLSGEAVWDSDDDVSLYDMSAVHKMSKACEGVKKAVEEHDFFGSCPNCGNDDFIEGECSHCYEY